VRLSHVDECNRDEGAHNDADGKHSKHEFCSPASFNGVASHGGLMAEGQVLPDTVGTGWSQQLGLSQRPAALGALALKQVAPACPAKQHFPVSGYLETFGY